MLDTDMLHSYRPLWTVSVAWFFCCYWYIEVQHTTKLTVWTDYVSYGSLFFPVCGTDSLHVNSAGGIDLSKTRVLFVS